MDRYVKTQQLITNALHRSKLDLRANVSFCVSLYIHFKFTKKYFNKYNTTSLYPLSEFTP